MKAANNQDPMAGISSTIQKIKEAEIACREENERVKQLVALQDALIRKQRSILKEVAKTSTELLEVELQRNKLKQKLASQKSQLLVSASESAETNSIIDETLNGSDIVPSISNSSSGSAALKAVELIQKCIFTTTEACLKTDDFTAPPESLQSLVSNVNQIIQRTVEAGLAKESSEDTVRRQSFVISSLIGPTPEDE